MGVTKVRYKSGDGVKRKACRSLVRTVESDFCILIINDKNKKMIPVDNIVDLEFQCVRRYEKNVGGESVETIVYTSQSVDKKREDASMVKGLI